MLVAGKLLSQNNYTLQLLPLEAENETVLQTIKHKAIFSTTVERSKELNTVIRKLYEQGYLAASIDSLTTDSFDLTASVYIGKQYEWARLGSGNVNESILSEIGFRDKIYQGRLLDIERTSALLEQIITHCENNGFPFASVKLDSVQFAEDGVYANLQLDKNGFFVIDSIKIRGDVKIAPVYIYNYIAIKPGQPYNESQINKIGTRMKELAFITEKEPATVVFTDKATSLILNLNKKSSSNFNGVLGVLPDEETGKILITGDARIKLQNSFGRGETVDLNWRRLQTNTQDLKTRLVYPFLFSTPFGIDAQLKLYKRDTLFSDVYQNLGIQYLLTGGNYFKAFVSQLSSTLLYSDGLENLTSLPPHHDVSTTAYGLGLKIERVDYRLNPRKGFAVELEGSIGDKVIKKNPNIPSEVYDSLDLKTVEYKAIADIDFYIPIKTRSAINLGVKGGYLQNSTMFENELYRIGGLLTLRGFDEESINTSVFSIFTVEYRYLLEQNSYAYLFWDGTYYENTSVNNRVFDRPYGFGAGVSFETKPGIFSINYALGHQFDNPILLKTAKIHFGFVNYF
ncbi:MAG: hypothetical protein V3W03_04590 [Gammaproteobacteria bacterium]